MPKIPVAEVIPLLVLEVDGSIQIVNIPQMSEQAFGFLKKLLDTYRAAIVRVPPDGAGMAAEGKNTGIAFGIETG